MFRSFSLSFIKVKDSSIFAACLFGDRFAEHAVMIRRVRRELRFIWPRSVVVADNRDLVLVSYRYVQPSTRALCSCAHVQMLRTPTQPYKKREKRRRIQQSGYAKDVCEFPLLLCCVFGLFFELSLYTGIYDWLPYKDLYTALSMLTHRLNVSLESLSRDLRNVSSRTQNSDSTSDPRDRFVFYSHFLYLQTLNILLKLSLKYRI